MDLNHEPFTTEVVLTDGGVYDNLGLETAWKRYQTVLVSDAGGKMQPEAEPERDWARHVLRILDIIDNQVRSLRKRQVIAAYQRRRAEGRVLGDSHQHRRLSSGRRARLSIRRARSPSRTSPRAWQRMEAELQERLINWGYAVCDAALRRHVDAGIARPAGFPYPGVGV